MPLIVEAPKPWSHDDWRKLPTLLKPEHRDEYRGRDRDPKPIDRCPHGVYLNKGDDLVQEWSVHRIDQVYDESTQQWEWLDEPEYDEDWISPWCEVCAARWLVAHTAEEEAYIRGHLIVPFVATEAYPHDLNRFRKYLRLIEVWLPGRRHLEYRYQPDRLFDPRKVYPESFSEPRGTREDRRLQIDPETGKRKWETAGGYVGTRDGYRSHKNSMGHGPDMDTDDIRTVGWAENEDSAFYDDDDEERRRKRIEWEATWPPIEEWEPYRFPGSRDPIVYDPRTGRTLPDGKPFTNPRGGLGLSESEFFADERMNSMDAATMYERMYPELYCGVPSPTDVKTFFHPLTRWMHADDEQVIDRAPRFMWTYDALLTHPFRLWKEMPCQSDIVTINSDPRPAFPAETEDKGYSSVGWIRRRNNWTVCRVYDPHGWISPIFWKETRRGWRCHFEYTEPSEQHFARWRRKKEYQRGGGKNLIPLRRTKRWPDDWRTERSMRDVAANIKLYRYGVVNRDPTQEALPDIPCKAAHRCEGVTREIQVDTMCQTAYENYRKARLALAKNHGTAGFCRSDLRGSSVQHTEHASGHYCHASCGC